MISSAVVIPDEDSRIPSPSLKRRQSSIDQDTSKRPRLDTNIGSRNGDQVADDTFVTSPTRRRTTAANTGAEEKKRGQRLFGALLGTLSQKSTKSAHRKRDEIEQRQRERLRRDNEEREDEIRQKRARLNEIRREEQKEWDKQCVKIRHGNMRAMAHHFQTETEPRLYYRPWQLKPEEEQTIKLQIAAVEDQIRNELEQDRSNRQDDRTISSDLGNDQKCGANYASSGSQNRDTQPPDISKSRTDRASTPIQVPQKEDDTTMGKTESASTAQRQKDDDQAADELVEGHEDDVIY